MRGLPSSTLTWSTHPSNHTAHQAKSITSILHSTTWWPYLGMMTISSKGISKQWYRTHYICISSTLTEKCTSISGSATWQVNWRKPYKSSFAVNCHHACLSSSHTTIHITTIVCIMAVFIQAQLIHSLVVQYVTASMWVALTEYWKYYISLITTQATVYYIILCTLNTSYDYWAIHTGIQPVC